MWGGVCVVCVCDAALWVYRAVSRWRSCTPNWRRSWRLRRRAPLWSRKVHPWIWACTPWLCPPAPAPPPPQPHLSESLWMSFSGSSFGIVQVKVCQHLPLLEGRVAVLLLTRCSHHCFLIVIFELSEYRNNVNKFLFRNMMCNMSV